MSKYDRCIKQILGEGIVKIPQEDLSILRKNLNHKFLENLRYKVLKFVNYKQDYDIIHLVEWLIQRVFSTGLLSKVKRVNAKFSTNEEPRPDVFNVLEAYLDGSTINITINDKFQTYFEEDVTTNSKTWDGFFKYIYTILIHELTHMHDKGIMHYDYNYWGTKKQKDLQNFFKSIHEMQTTAIELIVELKYKHKLSKQQVLKYLRHPTKGLNYYVDMYLEYFGIDGKETKRFLVYAYRQALENYDRV